MTLLRLKGWLIVHRKDSTGVRCSMCLWFLCLFKRLSLFHHTTFFFVTSRRIASYPIIKTKNNANINRHKKHACFLYCNTKRCLWFNSGIWYSCIQFYVVSIFTICHTVLISHFTRFTSKMSSRLRLLQKYRCESLLRIPLEKYCPFTK